MGISREAAFLDLLEQYDLDKSFSALEYSYYY